MSFVDYFVSISLALFFTIFIGRTLLLYNMGVRAVALGRGKNILENMLEWLFLMAFLLWVLQVIITSIQLDWGIIPGGLAVEFVSGTLLHLVGMALMSAGLWIFFRAILTFGKSWRVGIDTARPGALVTSGVFAYSRNPVFLSIDLYLIGMALIYTNVFFTLMALLIVAGLHVQILNEERFLSAYYGKSYSEYRVKVGRYFG